MLDAMIQAVSTSSGVVALGAGVLGALVTGLVTLLVMVATALHRSRTERERSDEQVSLKLLERRIDPYAALMAQLAKASTLHLDAPDEAALRAQAREVFHILHKAIYGMVGVLASTVTRETLLCARRRCRAYAAGECTEADMRAAIWAVHQMLRSDLNHHQDRVTREFDRVRARIDSNMTEDVIEYLVANMPHVQFEPRPGMKTLTPSRQRSVARQARRLVRF